MLIIIEGVDATGKTLLARQLQNDLGFEYFHFGPPVKHPIDEWGSLIERYNPFTDDWVMDRLHWGELVYAPHYRGRSQLGYAGFEWMERVIQAKGGVTILTEGEPEKILQRIIELDDDYVDRDLEHVTELSRLYKETLTRARAPVFRHNFDLGYEVNLNPVIAMARELERRATVQDPEYLGSLGAEIIFVGDVVGGGESDLTGLPFAAYDNKGCGFYLFETLLLIDPLDEYGVINAHLSATGEPRRHLLDIYDWYDQPRFVALGNTASKVLTEQGIPHGVTYHPQWVKRFKHDQQATYANSIWNAVLSLNDTRPMFT